MRREPDPSLAGSYRRAPALVVDPECIEIAVRRACAAYAIRCSATLAALNLFSFVGWYALADRVCGGHWACWHPPPSDYVPLLVASSLLTLGCVPTRARILGAGEEPLMLPHRKGS